MFKLILEKAEEPNCQHPLDHGKSKRVPEKHLFLLFGRKLLHFSWWRVACAGVLVPLLHVVLAIACGAGLLALLGNSQQGIHEQQSTVTESVETPPAPEQPAAGETDPL